MPYIDGTYYYDPMDNENMLSSGLLYSQAGATQLSESGYKGYIHPLVKKNYPLAGNWDQPGMLEAVNPGYKYDAPGFKAFGIPQSKSGVDNKQDYIKSLMDAGAVKLDGTPLTYDNMEYGTYVRVPDAKIDTVIKAIDYNPAVDKDWGPLIGGLFLGGVGAAGGFGGLFGAGEAAAGGAGSSLADLYGAATGTSVAAAPAAATGSALYGAATGAIPAVGGAGLLYEAATGGGGLPVSGINPLYSAATSGEVAGGMSIPQGSSLADLYGTATNQSVANMDWLNSGLSGNDLYSAATSGGQSAIDLIKQYGQPAAKALGLTNADGSINWGKIVSGGLSGIGGLLTGNAAKDAAQTTSDAIIRAAQIAADAAKFRPVGVTTRFGGSQFGYDANGNLTSAGYNLSPDIKAQQDALMSVSNNMLTQYQGAQGATAPMGTAAANAMSLGNSYLATTPQQQAAKYMEEQQALLAAPRERELAALMAQMQAQGRAGLAVGGTSSGMMAANPELEAYYNAKRQQDLQLASQATQGGMDYAKFGAGMVGTGGDLLNSMYGVQSAAYNPYKTAVGGAQYLEGLGQNAMDLGINIGAKGTASNAAAGSLLANGMTQAAQVMQPANAYSPWGAMLSGAGNALSTYGQQPEYKFDPFTGRAL